MVVNLWNTNSSNLSEQLLLGNQTQQAPTSTETQLREQLCALQSNIQQLSPLNHHQLASSGSVSSPRSAFTSPDPSVTPLNTYGTQPTSTSLLLAAQLLFGTQAENTPPQLVSSLNSNLLSPGAHQQLLMDTSHINGTLQSTGSGDAGSPSSSNSNDINGDAEGAEGVWSADIDQAFHEALQIYPPCGRRKIILSEEGKMYGRNELIARYIKIRCGKTRTRKQVSSHIQVLARKKNREAQSKVKTHDSIKPEPHGSNFGSPKSADSLGHQPQISPSTALTNPLFKQQIKVESLTKAVDSLANVGVVPTQPQQTLAAGLQWPYNLPGMLNNNFYGNVGLNNDENLYANFAAALNAQQQIQSFGVQVPSTANASLLSLGGLPALNKILPNLPLPGNPLLTGAASLIADTPSAHIIGSSKLTLHGFTAYMERENHRAEIVKIPAIIEEPLESIRFESIQAKFPEELGDLFRSGPSDAFFLIKCWANLNFDVNLADNENDLYAVDSLYESPHNFEITISSKVCSFGKQVVEKVEVYTANDDEQKSQTSSANSFPPFNYKLEKSPMCEYMVAFIRELKKLENSEMNNCVLENFTILQVIQNKQNDETLMTLAFMFEVSPEPESNCRIYRIVP